MLTCRIIDMKRFLHGMFGWDPLFFAPIKARRTSRIPIVRHSTDQGFLMLFKNESLRFRAKVVFLFQNGPDSHKWVAGEREEIPSTYFFYITER